ncbi:hsp90 co-chaperone Cdc37 [Quaeritorhiza haematococci]|nr:hsp90 co-chaperone Cdc37 [Quaeritorhiza haematococci]
MVRWRQAQIHLERRERSDKIQALLWEMDLNGKMKTALEDLSKSLSPIAETTDSAAAAAASLSALTINPGANALLQRLEDLLKQFKDWSAQYGQDVHMLRSSNRDPRWADYQPQPFLEKRVAKESLVQKVIDEVKKVATGGTSQQEIEETERKQKEAALTAIQKSISALQARQADVDKEIAKEEAEKNKKITSENMFKEGFNKTALNKNASKSASTTTTSKGQSIETIHDPSKKAESSMYDEKAAAAAERSESQAAEADYITYKPAEDFSHITSGFEASFKFLSAHPEIATQQYSDEVLAEAFRLQMRGEKEKARNAVQQALILQYCGLLGKDGISLFFSRLEAPIGNARKMFFTDVQDTYKRISERVEVLLAQNEEQEEAERQAALRRLEAATQKDGTLALPLPPDGSATEEEKERAAVFALLPHGLQRGLLLQDVDEINAALAAMDKDEANQLMKRASEVGLIELQEDDDE